MGTRGFIGFVADGREIIGYNHWDSYPEGLGTNVLGWLRIAASEGTDHIVERVRELRVVEPGSEATPEDVERLREFADEGVSTQSPSEWYVLLRRTQGNPAAMLQAGVIEDASRFPADSLMAEYGYVVDLDAGRFEAYAGFQHEPHSDGRFADRPLEPYSPRIPQYYPVRLVTSWPLDELPSDDAFLAALGEED